MFQKFLFSQVWLKFSDKFKIIVEEVVHKQSNDINLRVQTFSVYFKHGPNCFVLLYGRSNI